VFTHLFIAPAAEGKTAYALARARQAGGSLAAVPRIVVASHLQARAARRRLAGMGGAIGVRVLTFDRLYLELLDATGKVYVELSEPVQYRLIRSLVDTLPLNYYAALVDRPGFVQVLGGLIAELKAARVHPDDFTAAVAELGEEPRLAELARVYAAYQGQLQAHGWADRAGLGWLALEALATDTNSVARDWPQVIVDGFDSFTPIQIAVLQALARRAGELIVTLTGEPDGAPVGPPHRRFARTRAALERALGVRAERAPFADLPAGGVAPPSRAPALVHLARGLVRRTHNRMEAGAAIELVEAPDRAGEVRAALRWLKARVVLDGCRPGEVALLARTVTPYRPFVQQIAREFGLPIRLVDGLPLRENPAVAALLGLLRAALPDGDGGAGLSRRDVIEAWRSPYFDWSAAESGEAPQGAGRPGEPRHGIGPGDADALDAVARWGRVMGGRAQWDEAFERVEGLAATPSDDEERGVPAGLPRGDAARTLCAKFQRFVAQITPPGAARSSYREFVRWLETLIGADETGTTSMPVTNDDDGSLRIVAAARRGDPASAERDVAALAGLKDVLRGLVWAEEALDTPPVTFARFVAELASAVDAGSYQLPMRADREEVLVADVLRARGVPFRAVAVLGLAEGEFPATLGEDPFLRDADRRQLREGPFGLSLDPSTEGAEAESFYEAATRPSERLLLTRPRLADNGAPWQASPFWEDVRRLINVQPARTAGEAAPLPHEAASWPELLEGLGTHDGFTPVRRWAEQAEPSRLHALDSAARILAQRTARPAAGPFDGDLADLAHVFTERYGAGHTWSASRLESYRSCPFAFFVGSVLGLEPREEPAEGLNARQLGNIYHHIFERLYRDAPDPADLDTLVANLPAVAAGVLDAAPRVEGFRATAWWSQTRAEIAEDVRRSVEALAGLPGGFVPLAQEAGFFKEHRLTVTDGDDVFHVHGLIDRVDSCPAPADAEPARAGPRLRIIDYKTGGPWAFKRAAVIDGKKLQLPLYALAAEHALGLGTVVDGFYWHVRHAEASEFTLATFEGGPEAAIGTALAYAWAAVRDARAGRFSPRPPSEGCPDYCPAAAFCWHYRGRR